MPSLSARLTEAADALEDDLPEGVAVIDDIDGSPSLDELDRYCAGLMLEAAEVLDRSRDHDPATCSALDWLPIESAPQDGSDLLLICASAYTPAASVGWWANASGGPGWYHYSRPEGKWHGGVGRWFPTHWAPLPAPPSSEAQPLGSSEAEDGRDTATPLLHEVRAVLASARGTMSETRNRLARFGKSHEELNDAIEAVNALYARLPLPAEKGKADE